MKSALHLRRAGPSRQSRGVSLIEALVALAVMAFVRATHSSTFMPRQNTAMANAAACDSATEPDVSPAMNSSICSLFSAPPSRLMRMIS